MAEDNPSARSARRVTTGEIKEELGGLQRMVDALQRQVAELDHEVDDQGGQLIELRERVQHSVDSLRGKVDKLADWAYEGRDPVNVRLDRLENDVHSIKEGMKTLAGEADVHSIKASVDSLVATRDTARREKTRGQWALVTAIITSLASSGTAIAVALLASSGGG